MVPPDPEDRTLDSSESSESGFSDDPSKSSSGSLKSIGPYRLIRKLGEGGMGQVWLAKQTAPLERLVAIKLIRSGVSDDALLDRFESERQTLARHEPPCHPQGPRRRNHARRPSAPTYSIYASILSLRRPAFLGIVFR